MGGETKNKRKTFPTAQRISKVVTLTVRSHFVLLLPFISVNEHPKTSFQSSNIGDPAVDMKLFLFCRQIAVITGSFSRLDGIADSDSDTKALHAKRLSLRAIRSQRRSRMGF